MIGGRIMHHLVWRGVERGIGLGILCWLGLSVAGCGVPVPVWTGGDVVVKASAQPGAAPPERLVVIPYYQEYSPEFLGSYLLSEGEGRVRYPKRFHWGVFGLHPHCVVLELGLEVDTDGIGLLAFAPQRWPVLAHERDYSSPSIVWSKGYLHDKRHTSDDVPSGAIASVTLKLVPRSRPWSPEVAAECAAADSLGDGHKFRSVVKNINGLIEVVDSADISPADRLMVYRQLLELLHRTRAMARSEADLSEEDSAEAALSRRVLELCGTTGQAPPPDAGDDAAHLELARASLANHGIKQASYEWMGLAVDANMVQTVNFLLANGADPNDCWGERLPTPLEIACRRGHIPVAKALIAAGADVNPTIADGLRHSRPLAVATRHGRQDMARTLLDAGADINGGIADAKTPWTALHVAIETDDVEMTRLLLSRGARMADSGYTALHRACRRSFCSRHGGIRPQWTPIVELLLKYGAELNAVDAHGMTPLHYAIRSHVDDTVRLLVERGADVNLKDGEGRSPLKLAKEWGASAETVTLLKAHGAKK